MEQLLGWMNRKVQQNTGETLCHYRWHPCICVSKRPTLEDQQYVPLNKPTYSFGEKNSSSTFPWFFNGFPSKETVSDPLIVSESKIRTYADSVENVTENETELTEDDLELNDGELEKLLRADAKDGRYCNGSLGRTSHVSSITFSGSTDDQVMNGANRTACPLQGSLFGSPIDLPSRTRAARKERRTSLGELFQRTKMEEKRENKEDKRDSSGEKTMKKMLKWRSLKDSMATADSVSAERKLHKLSQGFNFQPGNSTATKRYHKIESKNNDNNGTIYEEDYCNYYNADPTVKDKDIIMFPPQTQKKRAIPEDRHLCYESQSNPLELGSSISNGNREYWITTDPDYIVLEL